MSLKKESISPLAAALEAAGIAGSIVTGLAGFGLTTAGIAVAGVALIGIGVWFLAKSKKINPVLKAHGLTPEGKVFACGVNTQTNLLEKQKTR